jgi:uncharacterized damage-inducible protein DinB
MAYTFKQFYITQIDYQYWAVSALLASLDTLDDGARRNDVGLYHQSIHNTVDKMLVVMRNWVARLKGEDRTIGYEVTLCADWRELKNTLRQELRGFQRWLEQQQPDYFEQRLDYMSGTTARSIWVRDALTHLTTELAHYRGQVAAVAMKLGAPQPQMEYVYYKRETEQSMEEIRKKS